MVDVSPTDTQPEPGATPEPAGKTGTRRRGLGIAFWLAAGWIVLVICCAAFGSLLPLQSAAKPDPCAAYAGTSVNLGLGAAPAGKAGCTSASRPGAPPSTMHWLGTDTQGRDTLARLVAGARVSMVVSFVAIGVGLLVGGTIGVLAGYFRGVVDLVLMAIVDVLLTFPALMLALVIVSLRGPGLSTACLAISVVAIPGTARIVRANTVTYATREFVTAARVVGARAGRIIVREVIPNLVATLASYVCIAIAFAIIAEGSLAYLNLSVQDPSSSWGLMILDGQGVIEHDPQVALIPAGALLFTVVSLNVLAERFRKLFGVREAAL